MNVGDGQKEKTDDDSYDSSKTQSYVTSNEDDSDEFDNSDNERCLRRFSRGQIHLSLKKKEVTVGSLANEEDHVVKPIQRLQNLYLWSK